MDPVSPPPKQKSEKIFDKKAGMLCQLFLIWDNNGKREIEKTATYNSFEKTFCRGEIFNLIVFYMVGIRWPIFWL